MDSIVISQLFLPSRDERGQVHLPGKELRYLRTVIVTADIDEGLRPHAPLRSSLRSELRTGKPYSIRLVLPKLFAERKAKEDSNL